MTATNRAAMSYMALVSEPAEIKGVTSWTVETAAHRGPVLEVKYSPNGELLATAGDDGAIRLWESATGRLRRVLVGHDHGLGSIEWSPDRQYLASAAFDRTARVWEIATGRSLQRIGTPRFDRTRWTCETGCAWSPDGTMLATVTWGDQGPVREIRDMRDGRLLRTFEGGAGPVAWSRDGRLLVSRSDGNLVVADSSTGKQVRVLADTGEDVRSLAWSPDGELLASATEKSALIGIWRYAVALFRRFWVVLT